MDLHYVAIMLYDIDALASLYLTSISFLLFIDIRVRRDKCLLQAGNKRVSDLLLPLFFHEDRLGFSRGNE